MAVEFIDNSIQIKGKLDDAMKRWLREAAMEITSETKRNMPAGQWFAQQTRTWKYVVDDQKGEAIIGNSMEQSLWTEFGTGEYALHNDGRKGWWVYVKDSSSGTSKKTGGKQYTKEEAAKAVAYLRSKGLDAHMTKGQKPHRVLERAFNTKKPQLISRAESILKGLN